MSFRRVYGMISASKAKIFSFTLLFTLKNYSLSISLLWWNNYQDKQIKEILFYLLKAIIKAMFCNISTILTDKICFLTVILTSKNDLK